MLDAQHGGIHVTFSTYGGPAAMNHSHRRLDHSLDPSGQALRPPGQRPELKRCPLSVHTFTGRSDIPKHMRECFSNDSQDQHVFVLYGLGGAGKTQVALKFVEMCLLDKPIGIQLAKKKVSVMHWLYPLWLMILASQVHWCLFHWCKHNQNHSRRPKKYCSRQGNRRILGEHAWLAC